MMCYVQGLSVPGGREGLPDPEQPKDEEICQGTVKGTSSWTGTAALECMFEACLGRVSEATTPLT